MGISMQNLLVILLIVLVLFGSKKIPELAKALGSGLREFKKAAKELDSDNEKCASVHETATTTEKTADDHQGSSQQ